MNNDRRKTLKGVIESLNKIDEDMTPSDVNNILEDATNKIEEVKSEEEDAFGNLSDGLQSSRQDSHDEIIGYLDDAIQAIESLDADDDDRDDVMTGRDNCVEALENID